MSTERLELEPAPARFVVGIDLGTTNTAVAWVDTAEEKWQVAIFSVAQLVAPGQVESRETLPSFHYQPAAGEFTDLALRLPWQAGSRPVDHIVGTFARDHGAEVPGRLVASAKSWLCHTGVDRTADLLPWHGAADADRLSPVEVSSRYLQHICRAWNAARPQYPLAEQDVVLTLPASFDEVARELTIEAAARAGLTRVVLIEEPQAAFYAWVHQHANDWEQHVAAGQTILVCDIGGGTSDFTLIRVRRGKEGKIQFHRVAVGDHLMLGGDNLDLALAYHLEPKLAEGRKLAPRQFDVLVRRCQILKEHLLGERPPAEATVSVPGSGARLIGGARTARLAAADAQDLLLEGFFPRVPLDARPALRASGFQEFGLPFAPDAAITRHLAAFLTVHGEVGQASGLSDRVAPGRGGPPAVAPPARPDLVLYNGGLFESSAIRHRLTEVIAGWFSTASRPWSPKLLENDRLDLAVARGAAYYGMVRRGAGVRISAELARTYYVGVEADPPQAVCLLPARAEVGEDIEVANRAFRLLVDQPVELPLLVSSTRLTDEPGAVVTIDEEQMRRLAPIRTVLQVTSRKQRGTAHVHLHARLTEIGTLQVWCAEVEGARRWRLEFDVRSATQTDLVEHEGAGESLGIVDEQAAQTARLVIERVFGTQQQESPAGLVKQLAHALGNSRWDWPPSLLRRIWEILMEFEPARRLSQEHEVRWLNLLGFALRPGYGLALDDWRVAETWRVLSGRLAHAAPRVRSESLILWRRIAGGLSSNQQRALAQPHLTLVRGWHKRTTTGRAGAGDALGTPQESIEVWRLLGALELLPLQIKVELGELALELLPKRKMQPARAALAWTLGRIGTRMPLYGPLNVVVPAETVTKWLQALLRLPAPQSPDVLAAMQLARRTGDRYRDIDERLRDEVWHWLGTHHAGDRYLELVRDGGRLDQELQVRVFGESLPKGLRLA
jgi:hypothetical protein